MGGKNHTKKPSLNRGCDFRFNQIWVWMIISFFTSASGNCSMVNVSLQNSPILTIVTRIQLLFHISRVDTIQWVVFDENTLKTATMQRWPHRATKTHKWHSPQAESEQLDCSNSSEMWQTCVTIRTDTGPVEGSVHRMFKLPAYHTTPDHAWYLYQWRVWIEVDACRWMEPNTETW